jgi:hypothetical protein
MILMIRTYLKVFIDAGLQCACGFYYFLYIVNLKSYIHDR